MSSRNQLFAPTFLYLHTLPSTNYVRLKSARGSNSNIPVLLQSLEGQEVAEELAWIDSWLERNALEEERKRRKKQEEDDEEAARQLNFQEHQVGGGLLEWYIQFFVIGLIW
jgi:hypothetical protein